MARIYKVVTTGGPCSGKTTSMNYQREKLSDAGIHVLTVRETATDLIMSGFDPRTATKDEIMLFEEVLLKMQLDVEHHINNLAKIIVARGTDVVILYDRGAMDVRAYVSEAEFNALVDAGHKTIVQLRDERYDAVIHMRTAAMGAEEFYTCANNEARLETVEEAIEVDERTLDAWIGHPHLMVIDNTTDFEEKVRRAFAAVCRVVGIPAPIEHERKFLVSEVDWDSMPHTERIEIEQHYLSTENPNVEERVRRRGQDGSNVYFRTQKEQTGESGKRIEVEQQISGKEFVSAVRGDADPDRVRVLKDRYCFIWKNTYYELDVIREPSNHAGRILMEVEITDKSDEFGIPPFITVKREVTDEIEFGNHHLALNS